jgi:hypothetical protein
VLPVRGEDAAGAVPDPRPERTATDPPPGASAGLRFSARDTAVPEPLPERTADSRPGLSDADRPAAGGGCAASPSDMLDAGSTSHDTGGRAVDTASVSVTWSFSTPGCVATASGPCSCSSGRYSGIAIVTYTPRSPPTLERGRSGPATSQRAPTGTSSCRAQSDSRTSGCREQSDSRPSGCREKKGRRRCNAHAPAST